MFWSYNHTMGKAGKSVFFGIPEKLIKSHDKKGFWETETFFWNLVDTIRRPGTCGYSKGNPPYTAHSGR